MEASCLHSFQINGVYDIKFQGSANINFYFNSKLEGFYGAVR